MTIPTPNSTEERIALIEAAILDDLQRVAPLSGSEIDIDYETGCVGFNGTFRPVEIARAIEALTRSAGNRSREGRER